MKEILRKSLVLSFYELKVKNHNTYLGFFWYFLQPLLMFAVLFYVKITVIGYEIDNFIPYLFIGVIVVHFFISSTTHVMRAVTSSYLLLNSRKVDVDVIILSKFFVSFWCHLFESALVVVILSVFGYYFSFLYLLAVPFLVTFTFGVGIFLCVLSTKFFDITYIWSYFCQLMWFVVPVYYIADVESVFYKINPLNYFLDFARSIAYNQSDLSLNLIFICIILSMTSLLVGKVFLQSQRHIINERLK